jgi:putative hydrolase of the HAD superfamily
MTPPTRAVLFDAGHTLVTIRPSTGHHYAAAAREIAGFDAPAEDYEAAFGRVMDAAMHDVFAPAPPGEIDDALEHRRWQRFSDLLFREMGVLDHRDALWQRLFRVFTDRENWIPYKDTFPAIEALRARGLKLAIVSNWSTHITPILHHRGLIEPFDAVIGSCHVGVEKPHPEIFRLALDALGVDAAEAIHVGDNPFADVVGARNAGIRPLLLDRHDRLEDHPDRIRRLLEIENHLVG